MQRNLDRRVEVLVPITNQVIARYLRDTVLDAYLRDNVNARTLRPDGTYRKIPLNGSEPFDAQMFFMGKDFPD